MSLLAAAMDSFQAHPHIIDKFCATLSPELIEQALEATGSASIRRRKLPAEQVVWLTVGMSMFTNTSIAQTVDRLNLTINGDVVASTVSDARKRLGPEPLSYLFDLLGKAWTPATPSAQWRGMRLFGVDGTTIRVPDSEDNNTHFGKPGSSRSVAAYPQVRVVALMDLGLRLLRDARVGPVAQGETTLARDLLRDLPDDSLCVMDRGFMSFANFHAISRAPESNRHFLCRARMDVTFRATEKLSDGSLIAVLTATSHARKKNPDLPKELTLRVVDYKVEGHGVIRLFTSLTDHKKYPARALAELYHDRWELELAFDELKTDMLNRKETLRSKSPAGIEQEVWAMLITYNLIRREMALTAQAHGAKPAVMSFKSSLHFIHDFFIVHSSDPATGRLPERLRKLRNDLWRYRLPPRRSERSARREVKIKMSSYPKKAPRARQAASGG
jgi:hypothetical protein